MNDQQPSSGGPGGHAEVRGDDSDATGGDGGDAVVGAGGKGGDARVIGNRSLAIGGKGGRGGIGPGQSGGDVLVESDDAIAIGGQGGEASQPDGRGGRGGRAGNVGSVLGVFGIRDHGHIKPRYGQQHLEPGRGGDSPDTPQYKARKLIIIALKERYFFERQLEWRDADAVWFDRSIVPTVWLNDTLQLRGYKWRVDLADSEYVFRDL